MNASVILAARRSAVVPRGGAFAGLLPHQIAAPVINAVLRDAGIAPDQVDELIAGNALGAGGNPARVAALAAGLPERVAGLSVDRQCAGGLDALILGDALIRSGYARVVVAGGVESYSRRPLRQHTYADGRAPEPYEQAPFTPWPNRDPDMAQAAHRLGQSQGISRGEQDSWAIESHAGALAAQPQLAAEIVEIAGQASDPFTRRLSPRLAARAPVVEGDITAANAAVAADAAAFCVMVAPSLAANTPKRAVRMVAGATVGDDPEQPGIAPLPAIAQALGKAATSADKITVAEVMEAYAVQAIACQRGAGLRRAIVNVGGGALARGHPVGASGAVLAVRLYSELTAAEEGGTGLAAIAAAGGLGTAVILRR